MSEKSDSETITDDCDTSDYNSENEEYDYNNEFITHFTSFECLIDDNEDENIYQYDDASYIETDKKYHNKIIMWSYKDKKLPESLRISQNGNHEEFIFYVGPDTDFNEMMLRPSFIKEEHRFADASCVVILSYS